MKSKIGFFGTPFLAARVLEDIFHSGNFDVMFAVTNPDKPIGRSGESQATPVKKLALEHNIPVFTPTKIRENNEFFEQLSNYNCDYFIVVAYGRILPRAILEIPKKKCINVHGSILPAYRGASPIQSVLLHGEKETGVTIMEMSEGMDEGDILKICTLPITDDETSETLFQKFAEISGPTLVETILELDQGKITPILQDPARATYCTKIEKEDGKIDWSRSAREIYHTWQAYTPWPGIYTLYEGKRLLLEEIGTSEQEDNSGSIGQVIRSKDGTIGIICSEGILTPIKVKLEGKKSQNIKDFVNGNQKFISYIL